jgi:hypothetical protein
MLDILEGRASSVRLEPPGEEGEGVDFWLRTSESIEYYQVKRQIGSKGRWTIADMNAAGVLSPFLEKLKANGDAVCVFVSTHSAFQLQELADRATRADSWREFAAEFLKGSDVSRAFERLRECWAGMSENETLDYLRRVRVETIDDATLDRLLASRLAILVDGDPKAVSAVLAQFALEKVNHELEAGDLWTELTNRGFGRRDWRRDDAVHAAVSSTVARFELRHKDASIGEYKIERAEAKEVVEKLVDQSDRRDVLVVSEAGGGKSQVLLQVVESLKNLNWPILAFAVDRLMPTTLPDDVGNQLGLPSSPAHVLAGVAGGRPCALVIDQLDAVSLASGRQPAFYEVFREIIAQAKTHAGMKILLACRRFDLDNDYRLKRLSEGPESVQVVTVSGIHEQIVKEVVARLGIDADRLSDRQLSLLSNPLHLSLFAEIAGASSGPFGFQSAKDLFDLFWARKQGAVSDRLGGTCQFASVVDALSDWMSAKQVLFAPYSVVDHWARDANAMTSEHVLVRVDWSAGFFHESFFDYAFARRFVARGQDILTLLTDSEQHLFRRAQVRQILVHERDAVRDQYIHHVSQLLFSEDIRLHIKEVIIGLLAAAPDPCEAEWQVLEQIDDAVDNPAHHILWRALYGKDRWFKLLSSLGVVQGMLADSDRARGDLGIQLLRGVQRNCPDEVAGLVRPYIGSSEAWNQRLLWLMQWSEVDASREFFDLFLELLDRGILDEARGPLAANSEFWNLFTFLPSRHPEWGCEVIRHYLDRRLDLSLQRGQPNPFDRSTGTIPYSQFHKDTIAESAKGAPKTFVEAILPFMLRVIGLTMEPPRNGPRRDPIWCHRIYGGGYGLDDDLLGGMETALRSLAGSEPGYIRSLCQSLRQVDSETIQYLIVRAYSANGAALAEDAVECVVASPERLHTGYLSDSHWAARELIAAVSPHCSERSLQSLEDLLLNYYPDWERRAEGRRSHGHAQFELLGGIAESRRSDRVRRRLGELSRRFGRDDVSRPEPMEVRTVGSPIPASAAEKMSNDQWIGAIKRYSGSQNDAADWLKGGAQELSQVLEAETGKDPDRFALLAEAIPDDAHPSFFDAILRGVTRSALTPSAIADLCRRCHRIPTRPTGRWLCELIRNIAPSDAIADDLLDMVAWYATDDPDPESDIWRTTPPGGDSPYYGGDAVSAGLNSTRGSALLAIAALIFYHPRRAARFMPALEKDVSDPILSVRAWGIEALRALLTADRDMAVKLVLRLLDAEDSILRASTVERFLRDALPTHYQTLRPVLQRMLTSAIPEVAEAGARQASLAALTLDEAADLADACMAGTSQQRKGAAEVFAANLGSADHRQFCEASLSRLFSDSEEEVRHEAATCFRHLGVQPINDYASLVDEFLQSPAFQSNFDDLILTLDRSEVPLPEFAHRVCNRFVEVAGSEAGDIRTRSAGTATEVTRLILRLYSQTNQEAMRSHCLDVIDAMVAVGTYGLDQAIESYER